MTLKHNNNVNELPNIEFLLTRTEQKIYMKIIKGGQMGS